MQTQKISYKRHRFSPEIIARVVWFYVRFNLSLREVEELMLEHGVDVLYETIRRWSVKFGNLIAHVLLRRQPRPGDIWHLDEVVAKIAAGHTGSGARSANTVLFLIPPIEARQARRKAAFGQADEKLGLRAKKDHYGQTALLWCRQT
jgi:putative transposase